MTAQRNLEPIVIAIDVNEPELSDRIAALLADTPGLRLAAPGEVGDVVLTIAARASQAEQQSGLTPREIEVLTLLAEGVSNKEIARRLDISVHTAKFHVGSVLEKLDATGRTDAVAHAARLGVIHL